MKTSFKSVVYFIVFFIALGYLVISGSILGDNNFSIFLQIIAGFFFGWSIYVMQFRINIFPEVPDYTDLITEGPYSLVRHPMYFSLILFGISLLLNSFTFHRIIAFTALFGILIVKTIHEEKMLIKEFPDYKNYKKDTYRLIPFLF
jgi:protein-S-isoprenylcysteine O-methyltransferase Ste14